MKKFLALGIFIFCNGFSLHAQRPQEAIFSDATTAFWINNYGSFRLSEKWFWSGEFHYRRAQTENTPYVGRLAQVYNRHGITYLYSKNFSFTAGGVLRFDFSDDKDRENWDHVKIEPRIWHEYLFAIPLSKMMIYHRLRLEHRWTRSHTEGSDFIFRNRWRYKFMMKIPLNKPKLVPGAYYFNPDIELIMQSGKVVIDSPVEDLRVFPGIGYIYSPRTSFSAGMMYTTGQTLSEGAVFNQRWIFKLNCYIALDFRKFENKIPEIKIRD